MNRKLFAENERHAWIFLNRIPDLGPVRFHKLLLAAKSALGILEMPVSALQAAEVPCETAKRWYRAFRNPQNQREFEAELEQVVRGKCQVVTELDGEYPSGLRELFDRPPVLYYKGRWPSAGSVLIGLVGTRHPSGYGKSVAERLTTDLHIQGIGTVSGLAQGIDTCVHQTSLKIGGFTAAVLGCGLGHVFPKENIILQEKIGETGVVVSEFPYNKGPEASHFPRRNRIISGLSQGVVVIEAGRRSGASITARYATEQGRDVFAVPGSIFQSTSVGCHRLIKQGAKLVENAGDILEELQLIPQRAVLDPVVAVPKPHSALSPLEECIVQLLTEAPLSVDEIANGMSKRFEEVAGSLLSLELKGIIRMLSGQRYARN